MIPIANYIFFNSKAGIGDSNVYYNSPLAEIMTVKFAATGTFSATFYGKIGDEVSWSPITAINTYNLAFSSIATMNNAIFQIDISGLSSIKVVLTANGGVVTCTGRVVG